MRTVRHDPRACALGPLTITTELQDRFGVGAEFAEAAGGGGGFEIFIPVRDHRFHPGAAAGRVEQIGEAAFDDFDYDMHGYRRAGRRAEQPGERAIGIGEHFGAEVDDAGFAVRFLDRLHANARVDEFPVRAIRGGIEDAEHFEPVFHALRALLDEVFDEGKVGDADVDQRREIVGANGAREVEDTAFFVEKLRGPRGEGPEEKFRFAIEHAGVEVRHGHCRRGVEGLAVNFRLMLRDDGGVFADEPLSPDGETAEPLGFGDSGTLQERQTSSAGADENKLRAIAAEIPGGQIANGDVPAIRVFFEIDDAMVGGDTAAILLCEPAEELARDVAEVDVGAARQSRGGDRNSGVATLGEQRRPRTDHVAIGGVFDSCEEVMRGHRGVTALEEIDLVFAVDEAEVGHGADALAGACDHAVRDGVGPELFGKLELLEDLDEFCDVDAAVGLAVRRVAEFADTGVTGAGVVPAVGGFLGELGRDLVNLNRELRLEAFQQGGEVGGHDAAADHNDVGITDVRVMRHCCGKAG